MSVQAAAPSIPSLLSVGDDASDAAVQGSPFLRELLVGLDAVTLALAWTISELLVRPAHRSALIAVAVVVALTGVGLFLYGALGLYRARVCSLRSIEHTRLARACVLLATVGLAAVALLHGRVTNREVAVGAALALGLSALTRAGYRNWLAGRRRDGDYLRPVVLVGCGEGSVEINSLLECHPELGYRPVGVVGDPETAERYGQRWCGDLDEVVPALAAAGATGAIVCTSALDPPTLNRAVQDLLTARSHVQLSTGLRGVNIQRLRPLPLAHEPFFYVEPVSLARWQLVVKRVLDVVLAGAALVAAAPAIAIAALAIKLEDRGPVFFRQVRVGRDGQRFVLYKLRTMKVDAESELPELRDRNVRDGPLLKIPNDPRVRPLGRLLRAASIDELPQLWNVLNGTMSLVGPRPALPDEVAQFDDELRAREAVRPGITGLWQVEARDNPSFLAYRRFDLFYIQNWSVGLDLMILCSTAEALVARVLRMARHATEDIQLAKGRQRPSPPRLEPIELPKPRAAHRSTTRTRRHDRLGPGAPGTHDDAAPGSNNDGPISVLHVAQSARYGLQRYLEDLVGVQARAGWQVTVATASDEPLAEACAHLGAEYRRWDAQRSPGPSVARESLALRRIVDEVAPDVVHLHSSKAGLVGRLVLRGRRPTIFSPHAWSFLHTGRGLHGATLAWERHAASWADVVVCVSAAERARGEEAGVHARFRVVPNAVDLERFRAARPGERERARQELGLADGPLAVCVGRLVPQKGQDALVSAWDQVRERVPQAALVLVGEGHLGPALAGPGVTLVGESDAVRSWIVAADVVVQPSRWEGMSLTVLEALGCGRSVVATDVEGMREALGDDFPAGALVPLDDTAGLVAAVVERLVTPELRACEERLAGDRAARFSVAAWGLMMRALTRDVATARLLSP